MTLGPPEGLPNFLHPVRCLGEGGMGSVWSVKDQRTGRTGALKAIRPSLLTDEKIVRRFERELRTFAQLEHPYIVQILDVGRLQNGAPYMLMEEIDGVPLIDLPLTGRSLGELVRLFDRILGALGHAHARRIIHRDLKPDNVLVYEDELGELIPKLMDFGLAMVAFQGQAATRLTADGMVVGTPAYMAPEQACDEQFKIGPPTDLYAFGCMLFELLCGSPPHIAPNPMTLLLAHATKPPRRFIPLSSLQSASLLEPLIMRLLEKDPLDRFELAADVRAELRHSGLLDSEDDIEEAQIGSFGDTVVEMKLPEEVRPLTPAPARPKVTEPAGSLAPPTEAQSLVSVLNLREPPFVGRDEARNTLKRYIEDVREEGQMALCIVSGSTGVGKSRLLEWVGVDGETRGALRYLGVNVSGAPTPALAILLAIINRLRLKGLSGSQAEQALMRFFNTDDPSDWRVREYIELVAVPDTGKSSSSSTMGRLDLLVYAGLSALSESRPLLFWLDDTHEVEADPLVRFIRRINARQAHRATPILVVVIDRADANVPSDLELGIGSLDKVWRRGGIHLDPLGSAEMNQLTQQGLHLAPRLATDVTRLSEGVPLLAVALARQWHAAGLLESTPEGYECRGEPSSLPVPEQVHSVLFNQLRLSFGEHDVQNWRLVAELAVVLGRTFKLSWLEDGITEVPSMRPAMEPSQFLERVTAEGIVRQVGEGGEYEYSSGLLREGLLAQLPPDRRADLHRAAAHAMSKDPETDPGSLVVIAEHLLAGRAFSKAYHALIAAAKQMIALGRYQDARGHLANAQHALASQEGVTGLWDARVAVVWQLELEIALELGQLELARERVNWIQLAAARQDNPIWTARYWLGESRVLPQEQLEGVVRALRNAEAILNRLDEEPARDVTLAEVKLGLQEMGFRDALDDIEALLHGLERYDLLSRAKLSKAQVALSSKKLGRAKSELSVALSSARMAGDLRLEARALRALAQVSKESEELSRCEKLLLGAARCYEAMNQLEKVALCHRELAGILESMDRADEAQTHLLWKALIQGN